MIAASFFAAVVLLALISAAFIVGYIIAPAVEDALQWMKDNLNKHGDDDTI